MVIPVGKDWVEIPFPVWREVEKSPDWFKRDLEAAYDRATDHERVPQRMADRGWVTV